MRNYHLMLLVVPMGMVAGCMPADPGYGETHRWNIEQQVVDPDPQYAGEPIEGGSGRRAAAAVDRYNRGQVKQPVSATTTTSVESSGAAAGGGPQ